MSTGMPDWTRAGISQGEKAPLLGLQKYFETQSLNLPPSFSTVIGYLVPAGKTLYITQIAVFIHAYVGASFGCHNQIGYASLYDAFVGGVVWCRFGFNGGGNMVFPTPLKAPAGTYPVLYGYNVSDHNCTIGVSFGGYEL